MATLRHVWSRFKWRTYRRILPELWYHRLSMRAQRRILDGLARQMKQTSDPAVREKLEEDFLVERSFLEEAREEFEHVRSRKLVGKAMRLDLHGWPHDERLYDAEADWKVTRRPFLNEDGFAYVKKKIREEQKARLEIWEKRIAVFSPLVTPLVSALIGAVTALIARSC